MYAPVDTVGHRRAAWVRYGLVLTAAACLVAVAMGVVHAQTPVPKPGKRPGPSMGATPPATNYQLRCWQHGRLVLEEGLAELPADYLPQSVRLRGQAGASGRSSAYLVFSLGEATCFAKPAEESVVVGG